LTGLRAVAVIGGGIAGIQASLDLAERGFQVYLVERSPSIGGTMALLDKTFPTLDCAICILAPKMIEALRHPKIRLLTYSEATGLSGEAGDFKLRIRRRPRYVDEGRCTGCGTCASKCPTKVPDEYQMGMSQRKAIHVPFPQAVPLVYTIDDKSCIHLTRGGCGLCEKVCEAKAINFDQKAEEMEVNVLGIVVATGLTPWDPTPLKEYGYHRFRDVVTAMELERMITATGPTEGKLLRPSGLGHPKRIAFIQCIGSRDLSKGLPYCSAVCCMHATKEAILVKEHEPGAEVTIFYTDLRAFGKGFRDFANRARDEYGISYVRAKPAEIRENKNRSLSFWYENTQTGEIAEANADLLVLCTALTPNPDNAALAKTLGLELDDNGFFRHPHSVLLPTSTTREGVYVCGYAQGPKDIPDSIAEASGASALLAVVGRGRP